MQKRQFRIIFIQDYAPRRQFSEAIAREEGQRRCHETITIPIVYPSESVIQIGGPLRERTLPERKERERAWQGRKKTLYIHQRNR